MEHLEKLIVDVKESLEREFRAGLDEVRQEMRSGFARIEVRFDTQAARMDRHASLLQTGSRWTNRMNNWAEKIDQALETKDREIAELRLRLEKLERRNPAA